MRKSFFAIFASVLMFAKGLAADNDRAVIWVDNEDGSPSVEMIDFYVDVLDFFGRPLTQDSILWSDFTLSFDSVVSQNSIQVDLDHQMLPFDGGRHIYVPWGKLPHVWSYMCHINATFSVQSQNGLRQYSVSTQRSLSYSEGLHDSGISENCFEQIFVSQDGHRLQLKGDGLRDIRIYFADGRLMDSPVCTNDECVVDVSQWVCGPYCIVATTRNGLARRKFFKH